MYIYYFLFVGGTSTQQGRENTDPLPNPWNPRSSSSSSTANTTTSTAGTTSNILLTGHSL